MDPLAHTLVGATLAETGLKRVTRFATPTLLIGANLPDIDAVAGALGPDASLYYRRGWTHGVLAVAILPAALALGVWAVDRWLRRKHDAGCEPARAGPLLALAYLSVLTHPALDWLNTYGVRLLMPFDGRWFYGDALFIIDPWMWLLAAASVVLARSQGRLSGTGWLVLGLACTALIVGTNYAPWPAKAGWLVGTAILLALRLRVASHRAPRLAIACLILLAGYISAMAWGTSLAEAQSARWLRQGGHAPTRVTGGPLPANPFVRDVIAVFDSEYRFIRVDWFSAPSFSYSHRPLPTPPKPGETHADIVQAALSAPGVRGMKNWLRFPTFRIAERDDGYRVHIRDVRYSRFDAPIGRAVVDLDSNLKPR